ncbi:MAG: autotransporter assembly complex family protein [Rhizobiaceae bacterium]
MTNTKRRLLGTLTALSLAASVASASAFELFGVKLWGSDESETEDVIGEPQNYTLEFNVAGPDEDLKGLLEGASSLYKDQEKPASGVGGLLAKARGDYKRLLATLYGEGRYGGTISILVDGQEATDLAPDATLNNPATVTVSVDTGPLFHFRLADIANQAPPATYWRDEVPLPQDEGYRAGEVARSGSVLRSEKLAVEAWRQQGHAKAKIAERRVEAAHDQNVIDANITVEPGPVAYYGPVSVTGSERMDAEFIAYMTGLHQGDEFDPDDLKRANERLSRLEVFRALRIEEGDLGQGGSLPIDVTVQERALRRFGIGASYSTLDGAGFEAFWLHRNLFGRAERLRFDAKIAGIGPTVDPEELTYRVGVTFTKPGVFTPDTDFIASIFGDREYIEDVYTRTAVTAQAGFNHVFTPELSGRAFVNGGVAEFEDDVFGTRNFQTVGLLGGLTFDNRDNPADATRGYYLDATVEPFAEFEYGNLAARFVGEARAYYGFGAENTLVAAGRLKLGSIVGAPISELPPDKLFFAGGGGSVRGYGYRTIGVPVGLEVIGGRSLIEVSAELRARVTKSIGIVGFVDAGYVGAESFPDFEEELKVGVGAGLRYQTGLGPIRLDLAVPLNPGPDDPDIAFYVGIGQAF